MNDAVEKPRGSVTVMHAMLRTTYEAEKGGPQAVGWPEYRAMVLDDWRKLLEKYEYADEEVYQEFLERHPCLVPGSGGMLGTSGHAPILSALFSQPRLPDFTCKIPDFMWIAKDSQSIYPILIEIEAPSKFWFNKNGTPTAKFTQAMDQITQWKFWFNDPVNQIGFAKHYGINLQFRQLRPHYVLIYGRRHEANRTDSLAGRRQHLQQHDVTTMTFDRLQPNWMADQNVTVRAKKDGYDALYVPATFQIGPMNAEELSKIDGFSAAVTRSTYLSEERRDFLIRRIPYWQNWAKTANICVRIPADQE